MVCPMALPPKSKYDPYFDLCWFCNSTKKPVLTGGQYICPHCKSPNQSFFDEENKIRLLAKKRGY
jgi:Zn finger protein HypA/HybF involved in hydrogenase expression